MSSIRFFAALVAVSLALAPVAGAEPTEVGTTAATNTDTTGTPPRMASRNLFIGTNVFFEERIETSKTGQAQLLFLDESALTIGANSDVVLDKFVYDPKTSKGELALSIGAGLFRFVGGRISKTSGVRIETPTAYIGIRGGIVIIKVEPGNGATRATFVFGKEMTVTNKKTGVTRKVTRPGFSVDIASLDDPPSTPFKELGANMASYLTELEGRTGQTAGSDDPPTDKQVADSGIDQVGSSNDPDTIISEETAATGGTTVLAPIDPALIDPTAIDAYVDKQDAATEAADDTSIDGDGFMPPQTPQTPPPSGGVATSRTLTGFSGGVFAVAEIDEFDQFFLTDTGIFANASGDPSDIQIVTDATSSTVTATFDVQAVNAVGNDERLVADFGGTIATSAFIDDDTFVAISSSPTSATVEGAPVVNAQLFLATSAVFGTEGLQVPAGVDFCQCEFLQWGFWGGVVELSDGDHVLVLANWVAGEITIDLPVSGIATYSGHAIGTVNNDGNIFQAVGGYSQTYDFATPAGEEAGDFTVTQFDNVDYSGTLTAGGAGFTGSGAGASRDIDLNGAFFSGGNDPVAQVGGGFSINGTDYEASGIFAADKQP